MVIVNMKINRHGNIILKALIVYQHPESIGIYLVDVNAEDVEMLNLCRGCYIGEYCSEETSKALNKLSLYLAIKPDDGYYEKWAKRIGVPIEDVGKWEDKLQHDGGMYLTKDVDFVVLTGWERSLS